MKWILVLLNGPVYLNINKGKYMIISEIKSWLCTEEQYDSRPVGTVACIANAYSTDYAGVFSGKITVYTKGSQPSDVEHIAAGWINAPEQYPNGSLIIDPEMLELIWETKEIVDPCKSFTDDEVYMSATIRKII